MKLAQKRYKIEFEATVTMSEIEKIEGSPYDPPDFLGIQKRLQKAFLEDNEVLNLVFIANLLSGLEDYVGEIGGPEPAEFLGGKLTSVLDTQDLEFLNAEQRQDSLSEAITPATSDSVSVSIENCRIAELIDAETGRLLNPVWEETLAEHLEKLAGRLRKQQIELEKLR